MRLLDLISQGHNATIRSDDGCELPSAVRFSSELRQCPLRYVLSDELVKCATQLAYAEGDRLSACLDLIHAPARSVWAEWAEAPRQEALADIPALKIPGETNARRAGALVTALPDCRSGHIRTFWSTREDVAHLSPIVTFFDLDHPPDRVRATESNAGQWDIRLQLKEEPAIDDLLGHLRFSFDSGWSAYYTQRCGTPELRNAVLRSNLGGCAFDTPMLMAFFLLLGAHNLLPREYVRHERLNRARERVGKTRLLEHIEVSAPLDSPQRSSAAAHKGSTRAYPRLHHVRGHIVRRGSAVFWRSPHLRGSARLGRVRSRTVMLTFARSDAIPTEALQLAHFAGSKSEA